MSNADYRRGVSDCIAALRMAAERAAFIHPDHRVTKGASSILLTIADGIAAMLQPPPDGPSPLADPSAAPAYARTKGYTGDECPDCQNFTMVRNGTCLKCDTCGSTTGCS